MGPGGPDDISDTDPGTGTGDSGTGHDCDPGAGPDSDSGTGADPIVDVGAFIRQQREIARMSIRRLAETAGVSNPYLSQVERGLRRPSAEILQQVADALRISVESLYVKAGLLRDEERSGGVLEAIERDPDLTDDQKSALANVYRSFVERP